MGVNPRDMEGGESDVHCSLTKLEQSTEGWGVLPAGSNHSARCK